MATIDDRSDAENHNLEQLPDETQTRLNIVSIQDQSHHNYPEGWRLFFITAGLSSSCFW